MKLNKGILVMVLMSVCLLIPVTQSLIREELNNYNISVNVDLPPRSIIYCGLNDSYFDSYGWLIGSNQTWHLCNGLNGTVNLERYYIVVADRNQTNHEYNIGNTLGANTVNITIDNLPEHFHTFNEKTYTTRTRYIPTSYSGSYTNIEMPYLTIEQSTSSVGKGMPLENRPSSYCLHAIMRMR
jgi:hypothetical protein